MTTPGGVPNLPTGSLTLETLASKIEDMSATAMKGRAVERFPSIMDNSTGLSPASDLTPFGVLTSIWAGVNSRVATADPADIQGPEDLPGLVVDFLEDIPVVGQFIEVLEAILGTYDGDDPTLNAIQDLFAPINAIVAAITAASGGLGSLDDFLALPTTLITTLFGGSSILPQIQPGVVGGVTPGSNLLTDVGDVLKNLFNGITRTSATAATQADAATAVASQSDTVVGTASTMAQILAALGSGTPDADDFERTSTTTLGANWSVTQTGTGVLATPNGHDANFSGTGAVEFIARKTDKTAATLHQTSSIVLATTIPSYPFFTPLPYGGNIDLWVLMTAFTTWATRTGLRFRVNSAAPYAATWFMHWVNAGTETQLATGSVSIPAAGGVIDWEAGIGGNLKAYQARLAGSPVANFTDSVQRGTVGTHIYRGWGGKGTTGFGIAQGVPNIKQWTAQG